MTNIRANSVRSFADWLGIAASTTCGLHCALLPILLVTGTVLPTSVLGDESFHKALLWIILPTAIFAFAIGCWRHKDRRVMLLGAIGLTGILLAGTVLHDIIGETGERIATLAFAAVLVAAHYRNYQLCRTSSCDHDTA